MRSALILASTIALAGLSLTGCASASSSADATPSPTFTKETATTAQVASVIAQYEDDWREVSDAAGGCRLDLVTNSEGLDALTCSYTEQTAGLNALLAAADLRDLEVPDEMQDLVFDILPILDRMSTPDFNSSCLVDDVIVTDSDACTTFLGQRFADYLALDSELDRWKPYL